MMVNPAINQETLPTRLGAFFTDRNAAKEAAETLRKDDSLAGSKVELIEPGSDPEKVDKKLAPEDKNVAKTALSSHIWFGIGGLSVGGVIALLLIFLGPAATQSSPFFTVFALVFIGALLGLLVAGFISLRPDQDPLIMKSHTANADGRWTLVVHGHDHHDIKTAKEVLQKSGGEITTTL